MVAMLLEAAAGVIADERDILQARVAARWTRQVAGWRLHLDRGFVFDRNGMQFWVHTDRIYGPGLEIQVRAAGANRWQTHATHRIAHLGHGLDVLAAEDLIPAYLSTLARRALEDYAETLDRSARRLAERADTESAQADPREMRIRAATLNQAAAQARAFPRAELAVSI